MQSDLHELALDALYYRKSDDVEPAKSCFIVNEAAQRLRKCSAEAIPMLEEIIQDLIVPAMDEYRKVNGVPDWSSLFREGPPFAGLDDVLGAYWIICARSNPARAIEFMKSATRPVVNESVFVLLKVFNPAHPLSDVALPREYIDYVKQLSDSDVDEFSEVGAYVIERLGLTNAAKK
jgi:hypothetical protein